MARIRQTPTEEFEPYIEAVVRSGDRTRIILYVTLLVLFFVGCGIREQRAFVGQHQLILGSSLKYTRSAIRLQRITATVSSRNAPCSIG